MGWKSNTTPLLMRMSILPNCATVFWTRSSRSSREARFALTIREFEPWLSIALATSSARALEEVDTYIVDHNVGSLFGESNCDGSTDALYTTSILEDEREVKVHTRAEPVTIATFPEREDIVV